MRGTMFSGKGNCTAITNIFYAFGISGKFIFLLYAFSHIVLIIVYISVVETKNTANAANNKLAIACGVSVNCLW